MTEEKTPYEHLTPDRILRAVESVELVPDGRMLALNSYENRVYQLGMVDGSSCVAKFYRPGRWSDEQIREEHAFTLELVENEIPVVPPRELAGETLHAYEGYRFAVFDRRGGRYPSLDQEDHLEWIGRFIGRIHRTGASQSFQSRPRLDVHTFGYPSVAYLLENDWLPPELRSPYEGLANQLLTQVEQCYQRAGRVSCIRLHGDCHPGNILWTDDGPHFVDLDDCRSGPAIQDLWMLLSGEREEMQRQLAAVVRGYTTFAVLDAAELHLIEALRTLRLMHYAAWLARRWQDPAFPRAFPWFSGPRYWEEHILMLREQAALMDEMPLQLDRDAY
ncbi:MAG: serine/threonine protein kinase [Gammaproteobacteria bacterium]|nr:serine/threonine protein kinase [Gammaproteobacteria bacterium]